MGIQKPSFEPTIPSSSGSRNLSTLTSQQNLMTKNAQAQYSSVNCNVTNRNDVSTSSHEADIIELDITPPTSPSSLATHLTSRMEEVMANKSADANSNLGPHPEMIRSLNLIPTSEFGKQSSTSMNNGANNAASGSSNTGPSIDDGSHHMR